MIDKTVHCKKETLEKLYYCALVSLAFVSCQRNNKFYQGRVVDKSGTPVEDVSVMGVTSNKSVFTDENGYFKLEQTSDTFESLAFNKYGFVNDTLSSADTIKGKLNYRFVTKDTTLVVLTSLSVSIEKEEKTRKDTFQFVGVGENEDNSYLLFLNKKLDTTSIVFLDDVELDSFPHKMVEIDWYCHRMTSGGDSEVQYDQAFAKQYRFVDAKPFRNKQ